MNATERKSLLRMRVRDTLTKTPAEKLRGKDLLDFITSSKRNIPLVAELLSDPEPTTRTIAAACMCRFHRKGDDISKFRPKLEEMMNSDPNETVRMHASFVNSVLASGRLATAES